MTENAQNMKNEQMNTLALHQSSLKESWSKIIQAREQSYTSLERLIVVLFFLNEG